VIYFKVAEFLTSGQNAGRYLNDLTFSPPEKENRYLGYALGGQGSNSRQGKISVFVITSRPALGPITETPQQ
jgi:hypothetical protein